MFVCCWRLQAFLLDMLDSMPRLRLSDDHLKFIIRILKELDVQDVPSFKSFRRMQKNLDDNVNIKTIQNISPAGKVSYSNSIVSLVALVCTFCTSLIGTRTDEKHPGLKDYANPKSRPFLQPYVEEKRTISESWQAHKLIEETRPELLTPMWDKNGKHFFIFELTGLADGRIVIPIRWVIRNGEGTADAVEVAYNQEVR